MGRPRIYANDAERQRAFRARRRQATATGQPEPTVSPTLDRDTGVAPVDGAAQDAPGENGATEAGPTVWEIFEGIWGNIPEEEFEKLPKDGALEHDHYIYGTPKRYQ
jgi:hypothetical protein